MKALDISEGGWVATFLRVNTRSYVRIEVRTVDPDTAMIQQEQEAIFLAADTLKTLGNEFVLSNVEPLLKQQYRDFLESNKEPETSTKYNS